MSAFGYGSSYNPSWRGQVQPNTAPAFSGASPEMVRPNFSPVADAPWANPAMRDVGDWSSHYENNDWTSAAQGKKDYAGNYYATNPWANPLENIMGLRPDGIPNIVAPPANSAPVYGYRSDQNGNPLSQGPVGPSNEHGAGWMGDNLTPGRIRIGSSPVQSPMIQDPVTGQMVQNPYYTPTDAKDLYSRIGGMSLQQLQMMTSGVGTLADRFGNAAKQYANAYANPLYGKRIYGQTEGNFGGTNVGQSEQMDWLQKAYGSTMTRMNDNYLL